MQKGLTLPNRQWDQYTAAELAALDDLKPSILIILLYGGAIDQTHLQQLGPYLARNNPRIIYRPFRDDIARWKPEDWAGQCFAWINALGVAVCECIPANELNLEGMGTDWQRQIGWLTAFAAAWRKRSSRPLHLPALSPTQNYEYGLLAYLQTGLPNLFDVVDFHCYTGPDLHEASLTARSVAKPSLITEFNQVLPFELASHPEASAAMQGAVYFLLGGTSDQSQYDILKNSAAYASFKNWKESMPIPDFSSPNHGGPRTSTEGVVLHATLGNTASPQTEYDATLNWFNNPTSEVSAHAVVGPNGQVARPVRTDEIAWHAKAANVDHLGIEMAKAHLGDGILPDILDTTAKIVAGWCHDFEIPIVWSAAHGIEEHRNMPGNDHQDVGGPFDRADFLKRVKHYAGEDALTETQKKAVLDDLDVLWGYTKAATIAKNPAESEHACHERIVALKETLGLNR